MCAWDPRKRQLAAADEKICDAKRSLLSACTVRDNCSELNSRRYDDMRLELPVLLGRCEKSHQRGP